MCWVILYCILDIGMLWHREFGFSYKPNDLSLIDHTLFTGELGIKWKYIYTNIKDFKLECKYSTKLSQNCGLPGKKCPFCFESFSWNPPNLCPWLFLVKHIPFFENNHLTPAQPWLEMLCSISGHVAFPGILQNRNCILTTCGLDSVQRGAVLGFAQYVLKISICC